MSEQSTDDDDDNEVSYRHPALWMFYFYVHGLFATLGLHDIIVFVCGKPHSFLFVILVRRISGVGDSLNDDSDKGGEENGSRMFMFFLVPPPSSPIRVSRKLSYKCSRCGMIGTHKKEIYPCSDD